MTAICISYISQTSYRIIKIIEFVNSHVYIGKILIFLSTFLYNMLLEFF